MIEQVQQSLEELKRQFERELAASATPEALEALRVKFLGRKSELTALMKQLGTCPPEQRGALGKALNTLKVAIEAGLADAAGRAVERPSAPAVDVTLPGVATPPGRLHPIARVMQQLLDCFVPMGFEIIEGPELEYEWFNFDALNIPADHPSRESFDTFFVEGPGLAASPKYGKPLLRSHTSPVQIRVMQGRKPPLRIVVPGRVYRPDPLDASHSFMFHQVEGLMLDDRATFADLKGVLGEAVRQLFGPQTRTRFRPHFFPFTEPSAEVDIACANCRGQGCQTCGRKGWLEILGCGMVHPNVLRAAGHHPGRVQGFAFGMGVERIAMLKYGIPDIRLFFENDLRFLEQFDAR
jgi:phenylalanyl-tRNA synthetase alpha chain